MTLPGVYLALLLATMPVQLTLPAEIVGEPAEFLTIRAETTGKQVRFVALEPGLSVFPAHLLKDARTAVVVARAPGRYRLLAYTASGDELSEPAYCTVIIGEADTLQRRLAQAVASETDPAKAAQLKALASLYRQAAQDTFLKQARTWGALYKTMADAATILGISGKLPRVQALLAEELQRSLPSKNASELPLDEPARAKAAEVFGRIATALEAAR